MTRHLRRRLNRIVGPRIIQDRPEAVLIIPCNHRCGHHEDCERLFTASESEIIGRYVDHGPAADHRDYPAWIEVSAKIDRLIARGATQIIFGCPDVGEIP